MDNSFLKIADETPLLVNPSLIKIFGLREAIVIQQIHYWCEINRQKDFNLKDGFFWTYNTAKLWSNQLCMSESSFIKISHKLEKQKVIIAGNYNKISYDRTKWYRLNYEEIELKAKQFQPSCKICQSILQKLQDDVVNIDRPIPETSSKTSSKTSKNNNAFFLSETNVRVLIRKIERISTEKRSEEETRKLHALQIIEYYFFYFKKSRGIKHPAISEDQVENIFHYFINGFEDSTGMWIDGLEVEHFEEMIKYHFNESALQTDYNINHFATNGVLANAYHNIR